MHQHENECILHDQGCVIMCVNVSVCLRVPNKVVQKCSLKLTIVYPIIIMQLCTAVIHAHHSRACIYSASTVSGLVDKTFTV